MDDTATLRRQAQQRYVVSRRNIAVSSSIRVSMIWCGCPEIVVTFFCFLQKHCNFEARLVCGSQIPAIA
jgi:hypothetical protein